MSSQLTFLDTNVMVYAYDGSDAEKCEKSQAILRSCWSNGSGLLSTQVLQEFYVTVTRKLPKNLSRTKAREVLSIYSAWPVYQPTPADVIAASELEEKHSLSFWDALIIVAAQNSGATTLVSEDMQDGRQIGSLKIMNPFR
jgi:predicted nucleic acid-binding protein